MSRGEQLSHLPVARLAGLAYFHSHPPFGDANDELHRDPYKVRQ